MERCGSGARPGWLLILPLLALAVLLPRAEAARSAASLADRIVFVGPHSGHTAVLAVSPAGTRTKLTPREYPTEIGGDIDFCPCEVVPDDVAVSPDGSRVVFSSLPGGDELDLNGQLFSVGADGSDFRRLTFTPQWETNPVYSPDGSKLAFLRDATVDEPGITPTRISVVVANSDGTGARALAQAPRGASAHDMELAWHPDSKRLLFRYEHRSTPKISLINTGSGARQALYGRYAEFSPDGKLLAVLWDKPLGYPKPPRIYVGPVARFTKSAFTRTKPLVSSVQNKSGVFTLKDFSWLPDGRIVYLGDDERGAKRCPKFAPVPQSLVGVVTARGRQRTLARVCGELHGLSVSPSGTAILTQHTDRCVVHMGRLPCRIRLIVSGTAAWRPRAPWAGLSHRQVWGYEPTSKSYERRPQ